jgi:hypothetical protein
MTSITNFAIVNVDSFQNSGAVNATEECREVLESFAEACSDFMFCSMTNAHPILVCKSCIGPYNGVGAGYKAILKVKKNNTYSGVCT